MIITTPRSELVLVVSKRSFVQIGEGNSDDADNEDSAVTVGITVDLKYLERPLPLA